MKKSIAKTFKEFHLQHPEVWVSFERIALQAANKKARFGAGAIAEILRWESFISGADFDGYKINHNYKAFYARMFAEQHPHHKNFFRYRESYADHLGCSVSSYVGLNDAAA